MTTPPPSQPFIPPQDWNTHLPVNEVFGPTIQGEGPYTGRQASFIRLGGQGPGKGCNLTCDTCDTPTTWNHRAHDLAAANPMRFTDKIVHQIARYATPITVITGGEPLLHQQRPAWERLLRALTNYHGARDDLTRTRARGIHVETNGTIRPTDTSRFLIAHWSVSPKLSALGTDPQAKRIKPAALAAYRDLADQGNACLKIVCATPAHVDEAASFADDHGFRREHLWIMPHGVTPDEVHNTLTLIATPTLRIGANLSPRLHITTGAR